MQEVHNQDTDHEHVVEDDAATISAQPQAQNLYYPELTHNTVIYGEYAKGYGQYNLLRALLRLGRLVQVQP